MSLLYSSSAENKTKTKHHCRLQQGGGIYIGIWTNLKFLLRKWTTVSPFHPLTSSHFPSTKTVEDERVRHGKSSHWYIIHPLSHFQFMWSILMSFIFIMIIPLDCYDNLHRGEKKGIEDQWLWVMLLCNLVHNVHIIVTFFTGYISKNKTEIFSYIGNVEWSDTVCVLTPWRIAQRYIFSYFLIDMISFMRTVPLLIKLTLSNNRFLIENYPELVLARVPMNPWIVLIEMLRIIRLKTVFSNIRLILSKYRRPNADTYYKIVRCVVCYFFLVYFAACSFIIIPNTIEYYYKEERWSLKRQMVICYKNSGRAYTTNMILVNFMMETLNTMFGNRVNFYFSVIEDQLIFIALVILGLLMRLLAFLTAYKSLQEIYNSDFNYNEFINDFNNYLYRMGIRGTLNIGIKKYMDSVLNSQYFDEKNLLSTFSDNIKYEIFAEISSDLIKTCYLFTGLDHEFLHNLAKKLKQEIHFAGEQIFETDQLADCMYFIASGTVAVYVDDKEICHLSDGQYFGENGLLAGYPNGRRSAHVYAIEVSKIYRLDGKDFVEICEESREFHRRIAERAPYRPWKHKIVSLSSSSIRINPWP